jgi:hypothetical protein
MEGAPQPAASLSCGRCAAALSWCPEPNLCYLRPDETTPVFLFLKQ